MEPKGGEMNEKGGVKEKFSICRFRLKKVKNVGKLRMGDKKICDAGARHMPNQESGYAAGLPGWGPQRRKRTRGKIRPRQIFRKDANLAEHEKRSKVFCVRFPYLSFTCLFGALACYLSSLSIHCRLRDMLDFRRQSTLR